jgi:PAS domain-containing protein
MRRAARYLSATLAAVLGGASTLSAQDIEATSAQPPIGGLQPLVLVLLAITVTAVVAALIAIRRLRQANTLQGDVFGAIPQPRQVVDSNGRTIFANKAFYDFFGGIDKPTPELLAIEVADDEEARDRLDRLVSNARNGVAGNAELPVRSRDGAEGGGAGGSVYSAGEWRYVAAYPVLARPGTVLWMVDDITMRRQLEQVMQEEQERFVDLLEHAPIGFYSVDNEGRFLFANQTLCDWLGLSHQDLDSGAIRLHDVNHSRTLRPRAARSPSRPPTERCFKRQSIRTWSTMRTASSCVPARWSATCRGSGPWPRRWNTPCNASNASSSRHRLASHCSMRVAASPKPTVPSPRSPAPRSCRGPRWSAW